MSVHPTHVRPPASTPGFLGETLRVPAQFEPSRSTDEQRINLVPRHGQLLLSILGDVRDGQLPICYDLSPLPNSERVAMALPTTSGHTPKRQPGLP